MTMNLLVVQATLLVLYITIGPGVFSDAQELVPNETEERIENSLRTLKKLRTTREGLESLQQVLQDIDEDLRHQQLATPLRKRSGNACPVGVSNPGFLCFTNKAVQRQHKTQFLDTDFSPGKRSTLPVTPSDKIKEISHAQFKSNINDISGQKRSYWSKLCQAGIVTPAYMCHISSDTGTYKNFSETSQSPGKRDWPSTVVSQSYNFNSKYVFLFGKSLDGITRKRKGLDILRRILNEMDTDLMTQQKRTCVVDLGGHCSTESAAAAANQWMFLQSPYSPGKRRRRDTSMLLHKLLNGKE